MNEKVFLKSVDSVEAFYISLDARSKLIQLHGEKIKDYKGFLKDLQHGVNLFNIEVSRRAANDAQLESQKAIDELYISLDNLERKTRSLSFTSIGIKIQEAYSESADINWLEQFSDKLLRLKISCENVQPKSSIGQQPWDTSIAYYAYKSLNEYRNKKVALSDSPSSVLVKTLQIILTDIAHSTMVGGYGKAGELIVAEGSAIGMVRALKKALTHKKHTKQDHS